MKVVVINNLLKENHIILLRETAEQTGADLCFAASCGQQALGHKKSSDYTPCRRRSDTSVHP